MNLHELIKFSLKIGVFGSEGDHCSEEAKKIAFEVGKMLAKKRVVVFTGGGTGVMQAAAKGASSVGGLTISVLPGSNPQEDHSVSSITLPTGIGFARGQILTNTVHGAILVEGGLGTYQEAAFLYWLEKPTVAIRTSGGTAELLAGKQLDKRGLAAIISAESAEEAVEILLRKINANPLPRQKPNRRQ